MGKNNDIINRLAQAQSPYLQQHAHNPVDWYEWGEEALQKAVRENKPIIVSIGYAACHWCHVMAHQCFEDADIAALMNIHFVCIKVDREERPDIDQVYMNAAQLLTGSGGWPLNAIALPDGRPFFAGTYFPPEQWMSLLQQIANLYATDFEKVRTAAESLTQAINNEDIAAMTSDNAIDVEDYHQAYANHVKSIDWKFGGYQKAPKFMLPVGLSFFAQYYALTKKNEALEALRVSLDRMADGGIYDHLAGGFARYSTDEKWLVPHFEKMLYDNAQLISLYAKAYQITKNEHYAQIAQQTIVFCEEELSQGEHYFFSAIDADSEHEEGKFYVWSKSEIQALLPAHDAKLFCALYNISEEGNWEHGKNILHLTRSIEMVANDYQISTQAMLQSIQLSHRLLLAERNTRIRPMTDDKTICAWNALMATAYCDAYRAFGKKAYGQKAVGILDFINNHLMNKEGELYRIYKNKKMSVPAFLDDYAFFIQALIDGYEISFDEQLLTQAQALTKHVLAHFAQPNNALLYYTSDSSEPLIARKTESTDNVIPSSNAVMAHNFYKLSQFYDQQHLADKALAMLGHMRHQTLRYGAHFGHWAELLGKVTNKSEQIVIAGENYDQARRHLQMEYYGNAVFAGGTSSSLPLCAHRMTGIETLIYRCVDNVCELPTRF